MLNECHLFTNLNSFNTTTNKGKTERGKERGRKKSIRVAPGWICTHPPGCTWRWPRVLSPQGQTAEACRRTQQRAAAAER